jgi:S-DNA-T family DNA segregation ATPase FtsK/SpoIIIE
LVEPIASGSDGQGAFHRPPRQFPPTIRTAEVVIARPPGPSRRGIGLGQLLLPVLGTLGIVAFALIVPSRLFLIVAGAFVAISVASVVITFITQRRSGKRSARQQRLLYRRHLAEQEHLLQRVASEQRETAERLYPDPKSLATVVAGRELWERRPGDTDFLAFRLGRARLPLPCPVRLDLGDDPLAEYEPDLRDEAEALVARWQTADGLAAVASIADASVVTLTGRRERLLGVARAIIAQAAALRAPNDLRIIVYFPPSAEREWAWLKWLPHARGSRSPADEGHSPNLFLATTAEHLGQLLDEQVKPRLEQLRRIETASTDGRAGTIDAPHLLVIVDAYHAGSAVARLPQLRELETHGRRLKVHTVCVVSDGDAEPSEASLRLVVPARGLATLERTGVGGHRVVGITVDELDAAAVEVLARALAPFRLQESAVGIDLRNEIRLTDLLKSPVGPLCAPIGLADDGTRLVLDLKQPAEGGMGPHGLIVGATGSGKSELLRTIVAGLADAHGPDELSFVLVDFKGGAAFAELARLPHVAGLITNLQDDLTLVDRMHAALSGEKERRQSLLSSAGNLNDIGVYRALRVKQPDLAPLPYLLVIVDEFGELLASRPDFLDLFVAIGRVGRSIGMHLLLSSQRLDEGRLRGLEGHLRYRICLRTYSSQESKTVLGTADAYLLPSFPGVGYLRVDTEIYQRFKTARVTTPARRPDSTRRAALRPFLAVAPATTDPEPAASTANDDGPTDLDVLVERLLHAGAGSSPVRQVWLPPLPKALSLSAVLGQTPWWERRIADDPAGLVASVGLLDDPAGQSQVPLHLDLSGAGGHVIIVGAPRTGKSTFLATVAASLFMAYPPSVLHAYAIDLGGGLLRSLAGTPQLGGAFGPTDGEYIVATVRQMRTLLDQRESGFREAGINSMVEARAQCRRGTLRGEQAADVMLIVDNWGALLRDYELLADDLARIATDGLQWGVHLIVASGRWADVKPAVREAFGTRLELRLNDPMESAFRGQIASTVPTGSPGRGVRADGLHFQVALPRCDDRVETDALGAAISQLSGSIRAHWTGAVADPVRVLPERVARNELPMPAGPGIVLGVAESTLFPVELDLAGVDQHLLVLGDPGSGRTSLLRSIAAGLAERFSPAEAKLVVVDYRRGLDDLQGPGLPLEFVSRPAQVAEMLGSLRDLVTERLKALDESRGHAIGPAVYVLIDDYDLVAGASPNPLAPLGDILFQGRDARVHVVLTRAAAGMARATLDPILSRLGDAGAPALLLSGDPHEGFLLRGQRAQSLPPGRAKLVLRGGRTQLVQLALVARPDTETTFSQPDGNRRDTRVGA